MQSKEFIKINSSDKSILLFQVGEFAQLASHDQICATQHVVKKAQGNIERFTFALFFSLHGNVIIRSRSELTHDVRYRENKSAQGSISYEQWHEASLARYHAV
jgi:isopenicillin N synthase-like dioxygenase